jgi:diguanylate cyclase (GGDEF)-like protein
VLSDPGHQHHDELRVCHAGGGFHWVEATVRNLTDNPAVGGIVANLRDITERKAIQGRLAYDASHDALTGLANRATLLRELETAFTEHRATGRALAVVFVDLDGFKQVNDQFGHEAGDTLIVAVAAMLKRAVPGADPVGRLGGDEFGIVLGDLREPPDVTAVAERILAEMAQPVGAAGHEIYARASIGLAISSSACASANDLLRHADLAMYHAKRRGTHTYHLFTEGASDPMVATGTSVRW